MTSAKNCLPVVHEYRAYDPLTLDDAPKASEAVKAKSTIIAKPTTEEEWIQYERWIIKRKLQLQFDKSLSSHYGRGTALGRHLMPPMYFYPKKNGKLQKWKHTTSQSKSGVFQAWEQQCDEINIPTQISESKHYKRIQTIKENPVAMGLTPESEGCLYYVILRLPGVDDKYNDQGYIGKSSDDQGYTTASLATRWRNHNTASVIDTNLRLIQEYCKKCTEDQTTYYEMLSKHAAIFVLSKTTNQEELEDWKAYYMCQTYCTTHGGVGVMTTECSESGCTGTCINLGEQQYGMNDTTRAVKRAKSVERRIT